MLWVDLQEGIFCSNYNWAFKDLADHERHAQVGTTPCNVQLQEVGAEEQNSHPCGARTCWDEEQEASTSNPKQGGRGDVALPNVRAHGHLGIKVKGWRPPAGRRSLTPSSYPTSHPQRDVSEVWRCAALTPRTNLSPSVEQVPARCRQAPTPRPSVHTNRSPRALSVPSSRGKSDGDQQCKMPCSGGQNGTKEKIKPATSACAVHPLQTSDGPSGEKRTKSGTLRSTIRSPLVRDLARKGTRGDTHADPKVDAQQARFVFFFNLCPQSLIATLPQPN